MGEMAKALGTPASVAYNGQTYALCALDNDDVAFLEVYLEERAYEGVKRAARYLAAEEIEGQWAQVSRDIAAGVYSQGGDAWQKFIKSKPGLERQYFMMLRKGNPMMTEELAAAIFTQHAQELAAKAAEQNRVDDPNSPAPLAGGATIPNSVTLSRNSSASPSSCAPGKSGG
jgi:hypothetical protein